MVVPGQARIQATISEYLPSLRCHEHGETPSPEICLAQIRCRCRRLARVDLNSSTVLHFHQHQLTQLHYHQLSETLTVSLQRYSPQASASSPKSLVLVSLLIRSTAPNLHLTTSLLTYHPFIICYGLFPALACWCL